MPTVSKSRSPRADSAQPRTGSTSADSAGEHPDSTHDAAELADVGALRPKVPIPVKAKNGVELLKVPGWDKLGAGRLGGFGTASARGAGVFQGRMRLRMGRAI